jgi:hypothetical protein
MARAPLHACTEADASPAHLQTSIRLADYLRHSTQPSHARPVLIGGVITGALVLVTIAF